MNREEAYKRWALEHVVMWGPSSVAHGEAAFNAGWDAHANSLKPESTTGLFHITETVADGKRAFNYTPATAVEAIWAAWPVKKARGAALPAIAKAMKKRGAGQLLDDVTAYAAAVATWTPEQRGPNDCFVPMCSTWMNQERYLDDRDTWRSRTAAVVSQFSKSH